MSVEQYRRKVQQIFEAHLSLDELSLVVLYKDTETRQTHEVTAPFGSLDNRVWCMNRALALSNDLCRQSDIDNLITIAKHPRDISWMRKWPFTHQVEDMETGLLLPWFFIASEMRTGKSKIVVDIAQMLFVQGLIDDVIVVAPAPVRDVWYDQVFGQIKDHGRLDLGHLVTEFHSRTRCWLHGDAKAPRLQWHITNFEFLRQEKRVAELKTFCAERTLIVGDESSYLNSHDAAQTEAFYELRWACGRVILLNGTPIFHSPLNLFSQGNILHPSILECKYVTHFKARYAIQAQVLSSGGSPMTTRGGRPLMKIDSWTEEGLKDLQRRFAPYTVRRMQADCLDLTPKLDPVQITVALTAPNWKRYKEMRDEMVVWLQSGDVATSTTAATKVMRLAQITSGFLGGIEDAHVEDETPDTGLLESLDFGEYTTENVEAAIESERARYLTLSDMPDDPPSTEESLILYGDETKSKPQGIVTASFQEIGREKLDALLWKLEQCLEADSNFKVVAWHRFRAEAIRTLDEVKKRLPVFETALLIGGMTAGDSRRAKALLKPETAPKGPVFISGTEGTGSFGLDFTAAHTSIDVSYGYSPGKNRQKSDRIVGPAQTEPVAFFHIVATGPKGQKTIDHHILEARKNGEDVADYTSDAWIKKLREE